MSTKRLPKGDMKGKVEGSGAGKIVDDFYKESYEKDAEIYARLLENPKTPEAFRKAFDSLFTECLFSYSGVSLIDPPLLRFLLPMVMESLNAEYGNTMLESLLHVREALVPDEIITETLAGVHKLFEHRKMCGCGRKGGE